MKNEQNDRKIFLNEIKRLEEELREKYIELGFSEKEARQKYSFTRISYSAEKEIINLINSSDTPFEILELLAEEKHFEFIPNTLNTFFTQNYDVLTKSLIHEIDQSKQAPEKKHDLKEPKKSMEFDSSNNNEIIEEIDNQEDNKKIDFYISEVTNKINKTNEVLKEPKRNIDISEVDNVLNIDDELNDENTSLKDVEINKQMKKLLLDTINVSKPIEEFEKKSDFIKTLIKKGIFKLDDVITDLNKEGKLNKENLKILLEINQIFKEAVSEERIKSVRLNISKNPSTNSETLSELRELDDKDINISVAKHHKTLAETLESLYKNDINQKLEIALSGNINTPSIVLENLSHTRNLEVKFKLLKNRNLPSEGISNIFEFKMNKELLIAISKHDNISTEVVSELIDMGDIDIIKELFDNKKIDNSMFEQILNTNNLELLRKLASMKTEITSEQLNSLMKFNDKEINLNLLKRDEIGPIEIDKISKTDDIDILLTIIENQKTHEDTLFEISEKEIPELELSLAKNPNINAGTIDIIVENIIDRNQDREIKTSSEDFKILKNLGSNPNMFILTAEKLSTIEVQDNYLSKQLLKDMKEFISVEKQIGNTIENIYDQIGSPLWLSSKFDSSIKIEPATDSSMTFSQAVDEKYQQLEQLKEIEGKDNKELWVQAIKTNIGMNGN